MFVSKKLRLHVRRKIEKFLKKKGYISLHQAINLARRNGLEYRDTVSKIFRNLDGVEYVRIWNPGTIKFFKHDKLCPRLRNTVIAKKVQDGKLNEWHKTAFCTYDATDPDDLNFMCDILVRKKFKFVDTFPPLENEFYLLHDGGKRYLLWSESPEEEDEEFTQEDPDELMLELLEDQE